jgi:radical SAM superfamily enzyme YgiQ (UPF0313 family)
MRDRVIVGLVQVNNSFSGQSYFPYSVGVLQAYAQRHLSHPERYEFLLPIFARISVSDAVDQLMVADVVGFSAYVWNFQISLAIARELKRRRPETLIVFGGPHVPNAPDQKKLIALGGQHSPSRIASFLANYPFIDVAVHGEGEKPFLGILERLLDGQSWSSVPSLSYRECGAVISTPRMERMKDLDEVPSPYLEGAFDRLMIENPEMGWIAVWETNRGCPFGCTFCDWGSATLAKIGRWGLDRLYAEVDWFAKIKASYVFCADANFGILPHDLDIAKYCVEVRQKTGYPPRLSVQNTKSTTRDAMEKSWSVQKVLSDGGLNQGVVISMQSLYEPTLKAIKRDNMKREFFEEIQQRFTRGGVETMSDLILGLPEETYDSFADGVSQLIERGQHNRIQFNNCSILPNAEMGDPAYQRRYGTEWVVSKIVNVHGAKSEDDEVPETQQLVVATASMPRPDWVRARTFAWMTGLLHFDKVLQIPLILTKELTGAAYRELIELFSEAPLSEVEFPGILALRGFFLEKARDIQNGGEEYCHSKEWLDIWWPADELALIRMVSQGTLDAFYGEAFAVLASFAQERKFDIPVDAIAAAVMLNRYLVKTPFETADFTGELAWNVWDFYQAVLRGERVSLENNGSYPYFIDRTSEQWNSWADWCRRVVWYGNKRGAYLYGNMPQAQLSGHF